jgi:hypothetical protein
MCLRILLLYKLAVLGVAVDCLFRHRSVLS